MLENTNDSNNYILMHFNALNTFYLWLYGVKHMVKDHSDN